MMKQSSTLPQMHDFKIGVCDYGTPLTGVLIKCRCDQEDDMHVLQGDNNIYYLVD
jgi:hypothetical protein